MLWWVFNATFSNISVILSSDFTTKCLEKLGLFSEEKSFISCQNDLRVPSEMFHNVKLNKL
jgi:hypothetical protein